MYLEEFPTRGPQIFSNKVFHSDSPNLSFFTQTYLVHRGSTRGLGSWKLSRLDTGREPSVLRPPLPFPGLTDSYGKGPQMYVHMWFGLSTRVEVTVSKSRGSRGRGSHCEKGSPGGVRDRDCPKDRESPQQLLN